ITQLWGVHLSAAGGSRSGRLQMLASRVTRFNDKLTKEVEEARKPIDQKYQQGNGTFVEHEAAIAELYGRAGMKQIEFMAALAKDYTAVANGISQNRARLAGLAWRWEDVAFRRVAVADDVHDRAAKGMLRRLDGLFQLHV